VTSKARMVFTNLSLRFNGHFPGEPGLASVYWSKGWWRWWWKLDYWSYKSCKAPVKSSPPTNQQPVFYRSDSLPVAQPTVSKHWREKYHIPWTCLPQVRWFSLMRKKIWVLWQDMGYSVRNWIIFLTSRAQLRTDGCRRLT